MTTTNPTPAPAPRYARPMPKASDFAPLDRKADASRNRKRGTPKTRKRRFIL